ncbi:MAG: hypothetical protein DRI34_04335 [Deltaproteobacteria bacterium]|nr:MAG: hypothetical protein DRI34_04335 [Deltaproteobacteria bacterium]
MKDLLLAIVGWFADRGRDLAEVVAGFVRDFRESGRTFRLKVGLVGGYLAVSLATVLVFIPRGELNEIDAEVRLSESTLIGGRYFLVANRSQETWKKLRLVLNDRWRISWPRLRPGKKKAFFINRFKDSSGKRAPPDVAILKLRLECRQGRFERDYTRR